VAQAVLTSHFYSRAAVDSAPMDPIVGVMKLVVAALVVALFAGCALVGTGGALAFPDSSRPDDAPRFVTPAGGGPLVLATPVGGSIYQPVMGGLPIIGM
jgi:hypothetical protein